MNSAFQRKGFIANILFCLGEHLFFSIIQATAVMCPVTSAFSLKLSDEKDGSRYCAQRGILLTILSHKVKIFPGMNCSQNYFDCLLYKDFRFLRAIDAFSQLFLFGRICESHTCRDPRRKEYGKFQLCGGIFFRITKLCQNNLLYFVFMSAVNSHLDI